MNQKFRGIVIAAGAALTLSAIGSAVVLAAPLTPRVPVVATTPSGQTGTEGQSDKQEGQAGSNEDGAAGQSDVQEGQAGANETGAAGQSDKQEGQTGNNEDGAAGQSDKQESQSGAGDSASPKP